jgi:hypothetical protein
MFEEGNLAVFLYNFVLSQILYIFVINAKLCTHLFLLIHYTIVSIYLSNLNCVFEAVVLCSA